MARIAVQNETAYTVTDIIAQDIRRDAQEYFGDAVRSIRVQDGLARHAFNARTGEVRYAFSPQDFGLAMAATVAPDTRDDHMDISHIDDDDSEEETIRVIFTEEEMETASHAPALDDLEAGQDADDEEEDVEDEVPALDTQFAGMDEEERVFYNENDEDAW